MEGVFKPSVVPFVITILSTHLTQELNKERSNNILQNLWNNNFEKICACRPWNHCTKRIEEEMNNLVRGIVKRQPMKKRPNVLEV